MITGMRLSAKHPLDFSDQLDPTRSMRECDEFLAKNDRPKSIVRPVAEGVVRRVRRG